MPVLSIATLAIAACFAIVGALCAAIVVGPTSASSTLGEGWTHLPIFAGVGAFLAACLIWALVGAAPSLRRGLAAGLITALLAYPLTWYLAICVNWALIALALRSGPSTGGPPLNPLDGIPGAAVLSLAGLALTGWLTLPAGAVTGLIMAFLLQHVAGRRPA